MEKNVRDNNCDRPQENYDDQKQLWFPQHCRCGLRDGLKYDVVFEAGREKEGLGRLKKRKLPAEYFDKYLKARGLPGDWCPPQAPVPMAAPHAAGEEGARAVRKARGLTPRVVSVRPLPSALRSSRTPRWTGRSCRSSTRTPTSCSVSTTRSVP